MINPVTAGGSPLRKNIMLTGVVGMGAGQNNQLHVKYKVPEKFQRIGDNDSWDIITNNGLTTSVFYYIIFKVFM